MALRLSFLLVLAAALLPLPAAAQLRASEDVGFGMRGGFGWAGTIPRSLLGASGFYMFQEGRWGLYLDAKIPHDSPKRSPLFEDGLTAEQVQTTFPPERRIPLIPVEEWRIFNVGFVRPLNASTALVFGVGLAQLSTIQEYGDEGEEPINPTGYYFVQDDRLSGWEPTGIAAVMIHGSRSLGFMAGFDWAPRLLTVAAYYVPR